MASARLAAMALVVGCTCEPPATPACRAGLDLEIGLNRVCVRAGSELWCAPGPTGDGFERVVTRGGALTAFAVSMYDACYCIDDSLDCVRGGAGYPPRESDCRSVYGRGAGMCVLSSSGTPTCWDTGPAAALPEPPPIATLASIAPGMGHYCALTVGGWIQCWGGRNNFGQIGAPAAGGRIGLDADLEIAELAVGDFNACVLTRRGEIWCWGWDQSVACTTDLHDDPDVFWSPLGAGACARPDPWHVGDVRRGRRLRVGGPRGCLLSDGDLACWGAPHGPRDGVVAAMPPTVVQRGVVTFALTAEGGCLIDDSGELSCWGDMVDVDHRSLPMGAVVPPGRPRTMPAELGDAVSRCLR